MPFPHPPMQGMQLGMGRHHPRRGLVRSGSLASRSREMQSTRHGWSRPRNPERCAMGTQLLIGSRETPSARGKTFERRNPLTGDVATVAAAATVEDAVQDPRSVVAPHRRPSR